MKYTLITDVHMYGPHEMYIEWEFGPDCYYLGDNVDIRCCLKKNLDRAESTLNCLKTLFGNRFIPGNHELEQSDNDFVVVNNVLMTHGDYLFWNKHKADNYRKQNPCMNLLQYLYMKIMFGYLLPLIPWWIPTKALNRGAMLAEHFNCDTVVSGHFHVKKIYDRFYKGIRFISLPRGKTTLDL